MSGSRLSPQDQQRVVDRAMDLARTGRTAELAEFIDHGFSLSEVDGDGNSLLMLAAYHGRVETVGMLLERGADADLLNARGQSPVAGALFKGEDEVVRLLVDAGADLEAGTPTARATAEMFGRGHLLA